MGEVVDLTAPGTSLSPWRITLDSLIPRNSALRPSWLPDGLGLWATPSASVHWPELGPLFPKLGPVIQEHGGLMARPSWPIAWGNGFLQLARFILCLWNFLFHKFVFPSVLGLNEV